jgi:hypothetical protein
MHILRMRDAAYERRGAAVVPPTTLALLPGERAAHRCGNALQAEATAYLAAALVRATSGSITIGEYDPRVQPAHCKRLVGFVPHEPLSLGRGMAERFLDYRAALWGLDETAARERARELFAILDGLHDAFALPLVAALLPGPKLVVIDRPQPEFVPQMLAAVDEGCAALVIEEAR